MAGTRLLTQATNSCLVSTTHTATGKSTFYCYYYWSHAVRRAAAATDGVVTRTADRESAGTGPQMAPPSPRHVVAARRHGSMTRRRGRDRTTAAVGPIARSDGRAGQSRAPFGRPSGSSRRGSTFRRVATTGPGRAESSAGVRHARRPAGHRMLLPPRQTLRDGDKKKKGSPTSLLVPVTRVCRVQAHAHTAGRACVAFHRTKSVYY